MTTRKGNPRFASSLCEQRGDVCILNSSFLIFVDGKKLQSRKVTLFPRHSQALGLINPRGDRVRIAPLNLARKLPLCVIPRWHQYAAHRSDRIFEIFQNLAYLTAKSKRAIDFGISNYSGVDIYVRARQGILKLSKQFFSPEIQTFCLESGRKWAAKRLQMGLSKLAAVFFFRKVRHP